MRYTIRAALVALLLAIGASASAQPLIVGPISISAQDAGNCATASACATFTVGGAVSMAVDVSGTFNATLTFEGSVDGTTWRTITVTNLAAMTAATTTTAGGTFVVANSGIGYLRLRAGTLASGTAVILWRQGFAVARSNTIASPVFTGQAAFADGIQSAPSIAQANHLNTGFFFPANGGAIIAAVGGAAVGSFNNSNNSGIGTIASGQIGWSGSASDPTAAFDTILVRDGAANIVGMKNGANAQLFNYHWTTNDYGEVGVDSSGNINIRATEQTPTAPSGALAGAGAGNVDNSTHVYKETCITPGGETDASPASGVVTVADKTVNGKVTVTLVACGQFATGRNLYRSLAGTATPLQLVAASPVVADGATTTTYTDNIADASLQAGTAPTANTALDTRWRASNTGALTALATTTTVAGTAAFPPLTVTHGANLTTSTADAVENDGVAFYNTIDTTNGRRYDDGWSYFRLTGSGSGISGIADFFGANDGIPLVANGVYEIEWHCYFSQVTAGTATWTVVTATTALATITGEYNGSNIAGVGTVGANQTAAINTTATSSIAFPVTGTEATGVTHYFTIRVLLTAGNGASNTRLRLTMGAGTATPLINSYFRVRRLPAGNIGTFVS